MTTSVFGTDPSGKTAFTKRAVVLLALLFSFELGAAAVASAATTSFNCVPNGVAIFPKQRIHIRCTNPQSGIAFFAMSLKAKDAALMLPLFTAALALGKTVDILYDPADLSGAKIGCLNIDCRLVQAAGLAP